jgi:hypothetical protein
MKAGCGKTARPVWAADEGQRGRSRAFSDPTPEKSPNEAGRQVKEAAEGRGPAKGNSPQRNALRTQSRSGASSALERVRQAARSDRKQRFTALLHHVYDVERLHGLMPHHAPPPADYGRRLPRFARRRSRAAPTPMATRLPRLRAVPERDDPEPGSLPQ